MTVETTNNRIDYDPDGVQDTFAYDFVVFDEADMFAFADGLEYLEPFTVTGVGNPDGGEVIFDTAPLGSILQLTLMRVVPLTQESAYPTYGPFPAATHERLLDELTMQNQQQQEEIDRSIRAPINVDPDVDYTIPPYDAGKGLMWSEEDPKIMVTSDDNLNYITTAAQASADAAAVSAGQAAGSASAAQVSAESAEEDANFAAVSAAEALASEEYCASVLDGVTEEGNTQVQRVSDEGDYQVTRLDAIVETAVINKSVRQNMLEGPDMVATPLTVETAATATGDLTDQYHDLNSDMLTGSRGAMTISKGKNSPDINVLQSSILPETRSFLRTDDTNVVGSATGYLEQFLATGVQLGGTAPLASANLFTFMTNRDEIYDGNRVQWNDESGFFLISYLGTGVARDLLHPMQDDPLFFAIKDADLVSDWVTGRDSGVIGSYMTLNENTVEAEFTGYFPALHTDTYLSIGTGNGVNNLDNNFFVFGWAGSPLDDLHVGMKGKRGVTASYIYPGGSGVSTVDTGITDIQMVLYKSLATGNWRVWNKAVGNGFRTELDNTSAEQAETSLSVDGSLVYWNGGASDYLIVVIGSTAVAPFNKRKAATEILRKVGTGATGHRVDLGAAYAGGEAGGFFFGRRMVTDANNFIADTIQGQGLDLYTNTDSASGILLSGVAAFLTTGVELGDYATINDTEICQYTGFNTNRKFLVPQAVGPDIEWNVNLLTGVGFARYTGDGVAGRTLTHPTGKKPRVEWFKNLGVANWVVYLDSLGASGAMHLNLDDAFGVGNGFFNNTEPDETTITLGTLGTVNALGAEYMIYAWFGDDLSHLYAGMTGEEGVTAMWQYVGGSGAISVDTGIENITAILYKASSAVGNWGVENKASKTAYNLNDTAVELDQNVFTVEGSVVSFAGQIDTAEIVAFGSKADSGVDDQVILPATTEEPAIVSMANGFEAIGNIDVITKVIEEVAVGVTGPEGQYFIYMRTDGLLYYTNVRPLYLRGYDNPYARAEKVYGIDQAKMYTEAGAVEMGVFIGECWLDNEGNTYDIKTYARGDVWMSDEWTWIPSSYYYFDNPWGHTEQLPSVLGYLSSRFPKEWIPQTRDQLNGNQATTKEDVIEVYSFETNIGSANILKVLSRRNF